MNGWSPANGGGGTKNRCLASTSSTCLRYFLDPTLLVLEGLSRCLCGHTWLSLCDLKTSALGYNSLVPQEHPAAAAKSLQSSSDSVQPHRRQPTRLPCPWDSPGKNTGVGCQFLGPMEMPALLLSSKLFFLCPECFYLLFLHTKYT